MNRTNAAQYLPFVQALADGKELQILLNDGEWSNIGHYAEVCFTEPPEAYRIKPVAKELYRIMDDKGRYLFMAFDLEGALRLCANDPGRTYEKYVQVL